jgi:tRNA 2-thiouridine synthesizing protein A
VTRPGGRRSVEELDEPYLDTRGTFCPLPILLTERELRPLPPGARLTVVGDDPAIHGDVPAWCEDTGHHLVELEELTGEDIRFVVEKRGGQP